MKLVLVLVDLGRFLMPGYLTLLLEPWDPGVICSVYYFVLLPCIECKADDPWEKLLLRRDRLMALYALTR